MHEPVYNDRTCGPRSGYGGSGLGGDIRRPYSVVGLHGLAETQTGKTPRSVRSNGAGLRFSTRAAVVRAEPPAGDASAAQVVVFYSQQPLLLTFKQPLLLTFKNQT